MASKFEEVRACHNQARNPANMNIQKLVAKTQIIKFIANNNVHRIYIFFLQNLSAQAQEGTSKIVAIIQTIVIKNNASQKEKFK